MTFPLRQNLNSWVRKTLAAKPLAGETLSGVGEPVSRLGMKQGEMDKMAESFERALVKKEKPTRISSDVAKFRSEYQRLHYSFDQGSEAYEYFGFSKALA